MLKNKENWTTSNKEETSGGWYCRRCGIQLYSADLYCKECVEILEKMKINSFGYTCNCGECGYCRLRIIEC